jgi:hypothetical protein
MPTAAQSTSGASELEQPHVASGIATLMTAYRDIVDSHWAICAHTVVALIGTLNIWRASSAPPAIQWTEWTRPVVLRSCAMATTISRSEIRPGRIE